MNDACLCGLCPACRREDRTSHRPTPTAPAVLSEPARRILAEPAGYTPPPRPRKTLSAAKSPKRKPTAARKPQKKRAPRPAPVNPRPVGPADQFTPTPCEECGEPRIVIPYGRAFTLAGRNGLCELCFDSSKMTPELTRLEALPLPYTPQIRNRLRMLRRHRERVLRGGRPYHHGAPHGKVSAYQVFGCRCAPCRAVKSAYLHEYRYRRTKD